MVPGHTGTRVPFSTRPVLYLAGGRIEVLDIPTTYSRIFQAPNRLSSCQPRRAFRVITSTQETHFFCKKGTPCTALVVLRTLNPPAGIHFYITVWYCTVQYKHISQSPRLVIPLSPQFDYGACPSAIQQHTNCARKPTYFTYPVDLRQ